MDSTPDEVIVLLCVVRLIDVDTDLLITLNVPMQKSNLTTDSGSNSGSGSGSLRKSSMDLLKKSDTSTTTNIAPTINNNNNINNNGGSDVHTTTPISTEPVRALGRGSAILLKATIGILGMAVQPSITEMFFSKVHTYIVHT